MHAPVHVPPPPPPPECLHKCVQSGPWVRACGCTCEHAHAGVHGRMFTCMRSLYAPAHAQKRGCVRNSWVGKCLCVGECVRVRVHARMLVCVCVCV